MNPEQMAEINKQVKDIAEWVDDLRKTGNWFNELIKSFSYSIILPIPLYVKQMQDLLAPIQQSMANIDFNKIIEFKKRLDNINKSNFEYKWLRSVSVPFGTVLMENYEKNGNIEVNTFLIKLFRGKDEIETFKEWLKNQLAYEERKQIIDDCLQAHLDGKFTLSIPVLLAQCDGIMINHFKKRIRYIKKLDMKKIAKDKKIKKNKHFARQLIKIYDSRRIEILHGKNCHYFKNKKGYGEELSVKAIWTLFEIIHFVSKIE